MEPFWEESDFSELRVLLGTDLRIEHIIDIPKEIQPELHELWCIYKVPPNLRKLNEGEAYEPILISIGPFHHNKKPELEPMHKQKQRYFLAFSRRVTNKSALVNYKAFLSDNIKTIKHRYSEPSCLNKDEFVNMMLLDSVFIIELFLRKSEHKKDYIFSRTWISKSIQRDLLLLENQLPFFVLEKLCEIANGLSNLRFLELAFKYFEDYYPHTITPDKENIVKKFSSCNHFTDLVRRFYLPEKVNAQNWDPSKHFTTCSKNQCVLKTATKLNEAGVSFEKVRHKSLLDIKLQKIRFCSWFLCLGCVPCFTCVKTRFRIPQLRVLQTTECVLRNLIALEQCHYPDQPFMCNYVSLIDSLIHTTEDVELLVDKGIIEHELGSHTELETMINGLCKHVVVNGNYYGNITSELNDHYNSSWKHYMGVLSCIDQIGLLPHRFCGKLLNPLNEIMYDKLPVTPTVLGVSGDGFAQAMEGRTWVVARDALSHALLKKGEGRCCVGAGAGAGDDRHRNHAAARPYAVAMVARTC